VRGGSNSCKPVVVFASRTIKDAEAYQAAYAKYAEEAQTGSGVRAMFSFLSTEEANTALQFTWYDSPADLVKQPVAVMSCYAGSEATDYCQIWGGWDEEFKAGLSQPGCKFGFVKTMRGFLRDPGTGFDTGSPPMIWISKRNVQPGRMALCGRNFQIGTDMMFDNAPAALGICEYTSDEDADSLWSLRVFNDFDTGFKTHFPIPSRIMFRMVFNVIPEWMPGLFPIGFSFSSKEMINAAVDANGGNAAYKQYLWDKDLIGPQPDFAKGV